MSLNPSRPGAHNEKTPSKQWYAVQTYSGYEEAVARYLKQRVESLEMGDKIFNILVPKEKTIRVKGGKRQVSEEKIYPGYVLIEMDLTEDSWYVVRNTPRVTGFVGPDNTTPTAYSAWSCASERKKKSIGRRCPRGADGSSKCSAPSRWPSPHSSSILTSINSSLSICLIVTHPFLVCAGDKK